MIVERSRMYFAYPDRRRAAMAAGLLLALGLSLGGCATSTSAGSSLMDAHAEAPMPPKANTYLPVEDMPAPRTTPTMTDAERAKMQKDLLALRERQAAAAKAQGGPIANFMTPQ